MLGIFDQHVLLCTVRLSPDAYGVAIRDEIGRRTGFRPSTGAVYATLVRLEKEGLVKRRLGKAESRRGGRRKRHFTATRSGMKALAAALRGLDALREGTEFAPPGPAAAETA